MLGQWFVLFVFLSVVFRAQCSYDGLCLLLLISMDLIYSYMLNAYACINWGSLRLTYMFHAATNLMCQLSLLANSFI